MSNFAAVGDDPSKIDSISLLFPDSADIRSRSLLWKAWGETPSTISSMGILGRVPKAPADGEDGIGWLLAAFDAAFGC
jgi:hypothetical protein